MRQRYVASRKISIHLMLLFIIYVVLENMVNVGVSIHLMLLFIRTPLF